MTYIYIFEHETPRTSKTEPTSDDKWHVRRGQLTVLRVGGHPTVVEELRFNKDKVDTWVVVPSMQKA